MNQPFDSLGALIGRPFTPLTRLELQQSLFRR